MKEVDIIDPVISLHVASYWMSQAKGDNCWQGAARCPLLAPGR